MAGPVDALGPILEVMSWVGFVPGVPLLAIGWIIGRRRCRWISTSGEVFSAGGYQGVRWTDGGSMPRQCLLRPEDAPDLVTGSAVVLHYDVCHPGRWALRLPRRDSLVLILGWILASVGILCTVTGFVLLMF
jgi:hypothetical protein